MIKNILDNLTREYGAIVWSSPPFCYAPSDIDIFIPKEQKKSVRSYFRRVGIVFSENEHKIQCRIFDGKGVYFLDITFDMNYLSEIFPSLSFTKYFNECVKNDADLGNFFKYVLTFSKKEKSLNFVASHYDDYKNFFMDDCFFDGPIFRRTPTAKELLDFIGKKKLTILRLLTLNSFFNFVIGRFKLFFFRIKKGRIIAVVGADGSGKTTIINNLKNSLPAKVVYMGDWGFELQNFYNFLHRQHIMVARISYIFMFVENWIRYLRVFCLKIRGNLILVDRYPGLNRHLRRNNFWLYLNNFIYYFFPRADEYLFISAPPEIIFERKKELTVNEIDNLQINMRRLLSSKRYYEIKNIDLGKSVEEALRYILRVPEMPSIFVINLKTQVERRRFIEDQLNSIGLNYELINAVEGVNLNQTELRGYNKDLAVKNNGEEMVAGEIGCALSHIKIYERMVREDIKQCVVLEDDVVLPENFNEIVKRACNSKYDYVTFNYPPVLINFHINFFDLFYHPLRFFYSILKIPYNLLLSIYEGILNTICKKTGCVRFLPRPLYLMGAYLLRQSAAVKMLTLTTPLRYTADKLLNKARVRANLKVGAYIPLLVKQRKDFYTTMEYAQRRDHKRYI